jgi:hypothetical protein
MIQVAEIQRYKAELIFWARWGRVSGRKRHGRLHGGKVSGGRIQGRCHKSPDGSKRFLVGKSLLSYTAERLGDEFADPLKTTIAQNLSAMTTWSSPLIPIRRESLIRVKISTDKSTYVY